eukprot:gene34703-46387_t
MNECWPRRSLHQPPSLTIVATPRAGPRFRGCVASARLSGGCVVAYALNCRAPCSRDDKEDWEEMREKRPAFFKGMWWGGPCGFLGHRVLVHHDDALAVQNKRTTRSAGGAHYDVDATLERPPTRGPRTH